MAITAKELAEKLHLSAAAVSMALNNKPGVSTATRKQVLEAADKYGYDFTRIAGKHTMAGSIYFVIYKKHGAVVADTPFFSQLSDGIALGCKKADYKMKISYIYQEEDEEETLLKQIEEIQYSDCIGMILLGTEMTSEDYKPFSKLPFPVLLLDTYFETAPCDCVLINNAQGAYLAASHLIRRIKKQPGYLKSSYSINNFIERSAGFYKALRAHGMSGSKSIVHELTPSMEGAYADMLEILESGEELAPCYFADNDLIAVGAMKAFKKKGYSLPQDISVVGFDNIPVSNVIEPSLTTVHVPKQYMGEAAAKRLITRIKEPGLPAVKIEITTTLVKRHS